MFEVNGVYANRKGMYTIISVDPPKMTVRYEDGTTATLNMAIQARIWGNIELDMEAKVALARKNKRAQKTPGVNFYIKAVSMVAEEENSAPGWREKTVVARKTGPALVLGDRLLFYAVEDRVFFAVATVTGKGSKKSPKGVFLPAKDRNKLLFYAMDMDGFIRNLSLGISIDSVELESVPNYATRLSQADTFLVINEDDFEVLAEVVSEAVEEDDTTVKPEGDEEFEE